MVQGRWFPMGSDLSQPLAVRMAVFGTGRDALDDGAQQVAVYDGEQPVGSARLWWQDGAFWLASTILQRFTQISLLSGTIHGTPV